MKGIWVDNRTLEAVNNVVLDIMLHKHSANDKVKKNIREALDRKDYGRALFMFLVHALALTHTQKIVSVIISTPWISDIYFFYAYNPLMASLNIGEGFSISEILNTIAKRGSKVIIITSKFKYEDNILSKLREEFLMRLTKNVRVYYSDIVEYHQKIYGIFNCYYLHGSMNLTYKGIERAYKGGEFLNISINDRIKTMINELMKSIKQL